MERLLILAGSGTYPMCVAMGARKAGVRHITMLALRGMTSRAAVRLADERVWFGVGEIRAIRDWVAANRFDGGIMIGQIRPLALFRTRFDDLAREWLRALPVKNAHTIFGKLTDELERAGLRILPASYFMDDHFPGAELLTRRGPDEREVRDIEFGHRIARETGHLDIGQTVVVKDGMVMAVEAFEGTDKAILRGGRLGGKGAVVVKAAKQGHDMRFDIPVIGPKTVRIMRRAGVSALSFQAGRVVMLERERVIAAANRAGIVITGFDSGLPAAPLRPI
jgi:DUF1009 family protein